MKTQPVWRHPVATREGGVDRNTPAEVISDVIEVATREGGVDRNIPSISPSIHVPVATREGGVDRNMNARMKNKSKKSRHPRGWRG